MSNEAMGSQAELRAARIRWTARSRSMNQASQSLGLRQMQERASALDGRLRHHREERTRWHTKWDDPLR